MIYYFATRGYHDTIGNYLRSLGKDLASTVSPFSYHNLPRNSELPAGTYIFTDLERLTARQRPAVAAVWQQLSQAGDDVRLFNHPERSLRRFELLRQLFENGRSRFNIFRVLESGEPWRYPVFVRQESEHTGNLTPLLHDQQALRKALLSLMMDTVDPRDLLIAEFCDTKDAAGIYRKYAAFRIGERILPRHVLFSKNWAIKDLDLLEPEHIEEVLQYRDTNPHEKELRELFNFAGIEYGRIDYAVVDGEIQVWEINTNPIVVRLPHEYPEMSLDFHTAFAKVYGEALTAINCAGDRVRRIPIKWSEVDVFGM